MATALIYVLVLLAVAAVIFAGASTLFGRGEELAPLPKGASPTWLPETEVAAGDVRSVRFQQAVRGYRMAEVDWVLDRVAAELERMSEEHGRLNRRIVELQGGPDTFADAPADVPVEPPPDPSDSSDPSAEKAAEPAVEEHTEV